MVPKEEVGGLQFGRGSSSGSGGGGVDVFQKPGRKSQSRVHVEDVTL